jgi:uncharacterized protein (TIGR00730 family)
MNICVYGASSNKIDSSFMERTENLGEKLASRGHSLVFGGGTNGLMGAVARGFSKQDGKIIGIAPSFFNVDGVLFDKCDEFIYPDTMRKRKELMEQMSDAFIMTPGGVGTFDEFFEIVTLKQLGLHSKPIAIFNINGYFDSLIATLKSAVDTKFMDNRTLELCPAFEDEDLLITYLENYKGEAKLYKCIAGEK